MNRTRPCSLALAALTIGVMGGCASPLGSKSSPPAAGGDKSSAPIGVIDLPTTAKPANVASAGVDQPTANSTPENPSFFSIFRVKPKPPTDGAGARPSANVPVSDAPKDPQPAVDIVFHVEVYQLTLPIGAVSQNPEFWTKLNEQVLDAATYDVLQRNGFRVGEASFADWEYFRTLIQQHPGTMSQAFSIAREQKNMQLEMKKGVEFQNIFHFDARNQSTGRTYEKCDNILSISFEPTPRRPGSMRFTMAPIVKSLRKRLEFSVLNDERAEVAYVNPEMLYDCNLRLDVPMDSFIVIAPSPEAARPLSVGNAFLLGEGTSQREERVIIVVPKPFRTGDPPP